MLKFAQTPLSSVSLSSFSHSLPYRNKSGAPLAQTGRRILSDAEKEGGGDGKDPRQTKLPVVEGSAARLRGGHTWVSYSLWTY